jgi:hypothetical protein
LIRLPPLYGSPISVSFQPELTAYRGALLSGSPEVGISVHAAAFIRNRQIILEDALLRSPNNLHLILAHEIFHFVWVRLGNSQRKEYGRLLARELKHGVEGELGESASLKKSALTELRFNPNLSGPKSRHWADYVCESFCDTAAYFYSASVSNAEFRLARSWKAIRRRWFVSVFANPRPL